MTPAEMEASSLALAYQLQQEEHAAFMQAVRVSSPAPRAEAGSAPAAGEPQHMETEDAESLQLAMALQQEELQWGAVAGAGLNAGEMDEDMRLAMQLARGED